MIRLFFVATLGWRSHAVIVPCGHNGVTKSLAPVVANVRNYQAINRRVTTETAVQNELLSAKEADDLRGAVGSLVCPADFKSEGSISTAFLFEARDEIVTAAHAFKGRATKADIGKCYFQNFAHPPERRYLIASHPRNKIPNALNTNAAKGLNDKVRIKLQSSIEMAKPITLDADDKEPYGGTDTLLVMAQNSDMPDHMNGPLISPCQIKMLQVRPGGRTIATDCDADTGGSGGVYLVRDKDGLSAKGIFVQLSSAIEKKTLPDHTPYDESKNASYGIMLNKKTFEENK